MDLAWIEKGEKKWEEECEIWGKFGRKMAGKSEVFDSLQEYVKSLSEDMSKFYIEMFANAPKVIDGMIDRGIIMRNEDGQLVPQQLGFEYTSQTTNAGQCGRTIYLNPKRAFLLYNSYRRILSGYRENIREDGLSFFDIFENQMWYDVDAVIGELVKYANRGKGHSTPTVSKKSEMGH